MLQPRAVLPEKLRKIRCRSKKLSDATVFVGIVGITAGCEGGSSSDTTNERVDRTIQPIIRGTSSGAEHDAVLILATFKDGQRLSLCTSTVVAPNLIVTARHCVSDTDSVSACTKEGAPITGALVKQDRNPHDLVVFLGKDGIVLDASNETNATARGAKIIADPSTTICNHDVAFVVLDRKLDAPIAQLRLEAPQLSERLDAVGWGIDETGNLPKSREVRRDIALVGVGPALYPDNSSYGYGTSEFMVGESACAGDSGSPTFAASGAIVGVAARAGNGLPRDPANYASTCMGDHAHAIYTHLGEYHDLVTRAFEEAGEPIWLEGQPDPRVKPPSAPEAKPAPPHSAATTSGATPNRGSSPASDPHALAATGGCSVAMDPERGAPARSAGLVALIAAVLGLRRRQGRAPQDKVAPVRYRPRLSSLP